MNLDDQIFVNQIAQDLVPTESALSWFGGLNGENREIVLRGLSVLIIEAGASRTDLVAAAEQWHVSQKSTPYVVLSGKDSLKVTLARACDLRQTEQQKVFELFMGLLSVADRRRRSSNCAKGCTHWWHRDLLNDDVLTEIRRQYQRGDL